MPLGLSWVLQLQVIVLVKSNFTGLLMQAESEIMEFSVNVVGSTTPLFFKTSAFCMLIKSSIILALSLQTPLHCCWLISITRGWHYVAARSPFPKGT